MIINKEPGLNRCEKPWQGSLPLAGLNTFPGKDGHSDVSTTIELIRSAPEEKGQQIESTVGAAVGREPTGLAHLQATARDRKNIFAALIEAVKTHSLGQISHSLYEVGGEYRRNM